MGCCKQNSSNDKNSAGERKIHSEMTIDEILSSFPDRAQLIAQEITNAGLHCVGCQAATYETLRAGMRGHGMSDEKVDDLVSRLNKILAQKVDLTSIHLTPEAAKKFLSILEEDQKQGWSLRLAERPAGCNGFEAYLDFSEKALPSDEVFTSHGIEIHIDSKLAKNMLGTEISYIDALHNSGFKISNPNVRSSCGCGSSYGY